MYLFKYRWNGNKKKIMIKSYGKRYGTKKNNRKNTNKIKTKKSLFLITSQFYKELITSNFINALNAFTSVKPNVDIGIT